MHSVMKVKVLVPWLNKGAVISILSGKIEVSGYFIKKKKKLFLSDMNEIHLFEIV